ncbi:ABC transporter substrate-binding protein [Allohahella marinimesophila]|uniref:substrate-binding periplasmic protein n=1 Tax=Allohahella marinimesophila TaxID=1054972 RepID=UPI0031CF676D
MGVFSAKLTGPLCMVLWTLSASGEVSVMPLEHASATDADQHIVFADWTGAPEPFAASSDLADDRQGLIREVGHLLARALQKEAVFKPLPGGRIQVELLAGRIDANCMTSPKWWAQPTEVKWTEPLFTGGEGPIMRADMADSVTEIEDLHGKTVSLYRKFEYDDPLKKLIEEERIKVVLVDSLDKALSLLQMGRIDAHIEFTSVSFRILEDPDYQTSLKMAPLRTDTFGYSCAVADHLIPQLDSMNSAIQQAQQNGEITALLRRYNFPDSQHLPVSSKE